MHNKEFSITLDMVRSNSFHPFEVVECDTGNLLHILLKNDGAAMDLTGCSVCIVFASRAGFAMQDLTSGVSLGAGAGTIDVCLYAESFGPGEVTADVQVYSGENHATLITSKRFTFRCVTALISPDIIAASATYPPLVAATEAANEAAATALAAAASVNTVIGEMNVQADWSVTDAESDAYIKNKPAALIPTAHAASHASGGADVITPLSIGAANALHASRHYIGGADAITPPDIGAASVKRFTAEFPSTGWSAAAPYTQTVSVEGVTAGMEPKCDILFSDGDTVDARLAQKEAWLCVDDVASGAGSVTLTCFESSPETAFSMRMEVIE